MRMQMMGTMRNVVAAARSGFVRRSMCQAATLLFGLAGIGAAHASIPVVYDGPPSANTCTLAQAINAANAANGLDPASYGSSTPAGNCSNAAAGPNTIAVSVSAVTLTAIDNYWYGPNALPPIASSVSILGIGQVATIKAVHTGDPTPATANAFRFFYVSGGMELPAGSLSLLNVVLQSGYAKGGDAKSGGGGAGMGGAIFNLGSLTLVNVALFGNTTQGGTVNGNLASTGGGGMGQDATTFPENGAGFGGSLGTGGPYGGSGGAGYNGGGGGGGGGFITLSNGGGGSPPSGGAGGGNGGLGGEGGGNEAGGYGGHAGDGGGAGYGSGGSGGGFGVGGTWECQAGGVGGGGGGGVNANGGGAGGGFGGGGGYGWGQGGGGFGGGSGYSSAGHIYYPVPGFGGGLGPGNGAAMGGAIFNHTGTVTLLNVSAIGNAANGGGAGAAACIPACGSGLGAVVFNLNGTVTIDFSTLAGNFLSGNNAGADDSGPEDGTIYSLAYGNKIQDGTASTAALTIRNSIVHGTHADAGMQNDVSTNVVNVIDSANINTSSLVYAGTNFIGHSYAATPIMPVGPTPSTLDPLLGALSLYFGPANSNATPVLPIGSNSPAVNAAADCLEADASTTLTTDQRTVARPKFGQCDIGAYEFDGDYIFADGYQPKR